MNHFSTDNSYHLLYRKLVKYSFEEYLALEQNSGLRYEYKNGDIFTIEGGSEDHNTVAVNFSGELSNKLKASKSKCRVFSSDMKLQLDKGSSYVYPDAMVVCKENKKKDAKIYFQEAPILIVEVLSPTSTAYDKGDKFFAYRKIPSLQEYVLIEHEKYSVEIYFKKEGVDIWQITRVDGIENEIELQSLGVKIAMQDLYYNVQL